MLRLRVSLDTNRLLDTSKAIMQLLLRDFSSSSEVLEHYFYQWLTDRKPNGSAGSGVGQSGRAFR